MATVRQSITALYEEAQRSAVEGAPMLAVLQSDAAGPDALPDRADADGAIPLPVTAIAARFEELRRLAELEAGPAAEPSETPATEETRFDAPNDPLAGIDLSAGFGDRIRNDPADDATSAASDDVDGDGGVPAMDDNSSDIPVIDIPVTGFGAAPEDTGEPVPETPGDATPAAQAVTGIETGPSLPEEPPAPASDNTGDDLDIADIHTLVREAWEDETALGEIASPEAGEQSADHHAKAAGIAVADVAATGNIETAMQEIAAAVVQSADSGQGIDVEAMKREIIAAMRAELQAVVDSDLKSVIKTAVAEAMADMPAVAPPPGQAAKKAPKEASKVTRKAAPKAPAKKAAKAAAKAAAKTAPKKAAPKKAAAKKKTANGNAVDDNKS
ncbi:MAG: hypothetical protein VX326_05695 [Pseudomonadota bacterium]|nr:hypothetical protein [Pseudomonadota bacterium]